MENTQNSPKLPDKFSEDVLEFGSEVSSYIILDASDALHLNTSQTSCRDTLKYVYMLNFGTCQYRVPMLRLLPHKNMQ